MVLSRTERITGATSLIRTSSAWRRSSSPCRDGIVTDRGFRCLLVLAPGDVKLVVVAHAGQAPTHGLNRDSTNEASPFQTQSLYTLFADISAFSGDNQCFDSSLLPHSA